MSVMKFSVACLSIACAAAMCMLASSAASAIAINPTGYTQSVVAATPGLSYAFGGVVEGADGNIYVSGGYASDVYRVTPGGTVSTLTLGASANLLGVGVIGNTLYTGQNDGQIYTFDISLPSPTASYLATVPATSANTNADFAVAPAGFGAFAGKFIACDVGVYAVDPTTGARTDIFVGGGDHYSSLGFGPNGKLYVADYETGDIITVTAAGATSLLANVSGRPDGLAVHPVTGDIYVADSNNQQIYKITPAGVVSTFATGIVFSSGYYPSGLAFSSTGSTLYYLAEDGSGVNLDKITGFPTVSHPIPALSPTNLLVLALLIVAAGATLNRRTFS